MADIWNFSKATKKGGLRIFAGVRRKFENSLVAYLYFFPAKHKFRMEFDLQWGPCINIVQPNSCANPVGPALIWTLT